MMKLWVMARPPKAAGEPFLQAPQGVLLGNRKRDDALRREYLRVFLFMEFLRAAKGTAERLSRRVVAHRRTTPVALKVMRGKLRMTCILLLVVGCFGAAVGAKQVFFVEDSSANRAFLKQRRHRVEDAGKTMKGRLPVEEEEDQHDDEQ